MWKLTECQTSHPELPHPTGGITTFTQEEGAIHYNNDGVWSDGRKSKVSAVLQMDGTWLPITGSLLADLLSFRLLGDGSFEAEMKKPGAKVGTTRSTVSADGRTITWKTRVERQ